MKKRCESTAFSLGSRRNGDPIRGAPAGACCVCVLPQIIRADVLLIRNFRPRGGAARTGVLSALGTPCRIRIPFCLLCMTCKRIVTSGVFE